MTDYQEWLRELQKWDKPREHRIDHCLGSRDAFHWVRKNKWKALDGKPCDKLLYSQIISAVNNELKELLLEGHEVEFPYQMGSLVLNCTPTSAYYKNGEVENNYKIDWKKTLQWLFEDSEAMDNHKRLKRIAPFYCKVRYYKKKARYLNQRFYYFRVNRSLRRKIGNANDAGRVNAEHTDFSFLNKD